MKQFITECEPNHDGTLIVSGKAYSYLVRVRRMKEGDSLLVRLPVSGAAEMTIAHINTVKKELRLTRRPNTQAAISGRHDGQRSAELLAQTTAVPYGGAQASSLSGAGDERLMAEMRKTTAESKSAAATMETQTPADIVLLQWILKGAKTDLVVRQATEAGVRAIVPVIGDFSIAKKQNPAQLERYRRIIREARQQSGSSIDTIILEPVPLADALNILPQLVPAHGAVFGMCSEGSEASVSVHTLLSVKPSTIVLAIGAEGGISDAERAMLGAAGFQTIHFNTNVLRAETAAVYAIAAAQTIINEADQWQLQEYTC